MVQRSVGADVRILKYPLNQIGESTINVPRLSYELSVGYDSNWVICVWLEDHSSEHPSPRREDRTYKVVATWEECYDEWNAIGTVFRLPEVWHVVRLDKDHD